MALGWVVVLLSFLGCSVAQENLQASSQRCVEDTNTFLWEMNQDRPKEYAVLSKCCWLLKGFFRMHVDLYSHFEALRFRPLQLHYITEARKGEAVLLEEPITLNFKRNKLDFWRNYITWNIVRSLPLLCNATNHIIQ